MNGNQFFNDARDVNGSLSLDVSVSLLECCMDDSSRIDFEGGIQLLWLWRRRSFRIAVLQYVHISDVNGCSLHFSVSTDESTTVTGLTASPAGLTAPRNFHANNVTLELHYEF